MEPFFIVLTTFGGLINESGLTRFPTQQEAVAWILTQHPPAEFEFEYAIFSYDPATGQFELTDTYTESDAHLWNEEEN